MIRKILLGLFLILSQSCLAQEEKEAVRIQTGAEQIPEYLPLLQNKSVGVVVNPSSRIGEQHLVDTLISLGINIQKIFTPEHGFRGDKDAGELVDDSAAEATGYTIISLYGKNKKPSRESLEGLDIVLFDIQDVGVRFYTYASTMHLVMEACAEYNLPFLLLDRPNPNGDYVDGTVLHPEFKSFVGMHPIPVVHGLTLGELAQMINGEKWLDNQVICDLQVIRMKNYAHDSTYSLPVKPSPNLPNDHSIRWYPSLCFFEGTAISIGRGTTFPFQVAGYPDPSFGDFTFTPVSIEGMSKYPKHQDNQCFGVDLRTLQPPNRLDLSHLLRFYEKFDAKEEFFIKYFDTLAGTDSLRKQIEAGLTEEEIRSSWQNDLDQYRKKREQYLLYP